MRFFMKNANISRLGGFTLIELLVVVLIIGILAGVALPQYEKAVEKSRAAEAITLVSSMAKAEEVYFMANGSYSSDITQLDLSFPGTPTRYSGSGITGFQTKNFICRPWGGTWGWTDAVAVCNRLPIESFYAIAKLQNGKMVCRFYSNKGERVCKTLGTKNGSDYILH